MMKCAGGSRDNWICLGVDGHNVSHTDLWLDGGERRWCAGGHVVVRWAGWFGGYGIRRVVDAKVEVYVGVDGQGLEWGREVPIGGREGQRCVCCGCFL
jgi:hypothetical protein